MTAGADEGLAATDERPPNLNLASGRIPVAPGGTHTGSILCILPGRSIAFSPEWRDDGLSVLFDRNSGDYWIVSALARRLVELLVQADRRSAEELEHLAAQLPSADADESLPAVAAVLDELVQLGILGPFADSRARKAVD